VGQEASTTARAMLTLQALG